MIYMKMATGVPGAAILVSIKMKLFFLFHISSDYKHYLEEIQSLFVDRQIDRCRKGVGADEQRETESFRQTAGRENTKLKNDTPYLPPSPSVPPTHHQTPH